MKFAFLAITYFSSTLLCIAGPKDAVEFWSQVVSKRSLGNINSAMDDHSSPGWPTIGSVHQITPGNDSDKRVELAAATQIVLGESFDPSVNFDYKDLAASVDKYATMARVFGDAGGYGNYVLRDTVQRIIVFEISKWLIENPSRAAEVVTLLERCSPEKLSLRQTFADLSAADKFMSEKQGKIHNIEERSSLVQALKAIDLNTSDLVAASNPVGLRASALFEDPSVLRLVMRMTSTNLLLTVNLPGLAAFYINGGQLNELNPADIGPFEARMKGIAEKFDYPPLRKTQLTELQLLGLLRLHQVAGDRDQFLATTLK